MKKLIIILALMFLSLAFLSAAPGEYDGLKTFIAGQFKIMEETIANMDKATTDVEVAAALTKFKDDLLACIPAMKELIKQYPELEKLSSNPPEELKADVEKLNATSQKMQVAMAKVAQFQQSEAVIKAMTELGQVGQQLQEAMAPATTAPAKEEPAPKKEE